MRVPIVKQVPVPDINHPAPKYDMLPRHEFTMGFIGKFITHFSPKRPRKNNDHHQFIGILQGNVSHHHCVLTNSRFRYIVLTIR